MVELCAVMAQQHDTAANYLHLGPNYIFCESFTKKLSRVVALRKLCTDCVSVSCMPEPEPSILYQFHIRFFPIQNAEAYFNETDSSVPGIYRCKADIEFDILAFELPLVLPPRLHCDPGQGPAQETCIS